MLDPLNDSIQVAIGVRVKLLTLVLDIGVELWVTDNVIEGVTVKWHNNCNLIADDNDDYVCSMLIITIIIEMKYVFIQKH